MKLEEFKSRIDHLMTDAESRQIDVLTEKLRAEILSVSEAARRLDERLTDHIASNARDHSRLEARVNGHEHRVGALERKKPRPR